MNGSNWILEIHDMVRRLEMSKLQGYNVRIEKSILRIHSEVVRCLKIVMETFE